MPESPGFVAFGVELLSRVGPVRARAMFGGHGVHGGHGAVGAAGPRGGAAGGEGKNGQGIEKGRETG